MKEMNREVKEYFDTLPQNIKMSVAESDAEFSTVEDLKKVAETYMNTKE